MPTRPQSQQHFCMIAHPCIPFAKLFMIQWSQSRHWGGRGPWDYSLVVTWWEDSTQLASITYFTFSPKMHRARWARAFYFLVPRWLRRRGGRGLEKRRLDGHVWGNPWSWEFSPTRCLLFAYAVPTRGSSFIFGFWPCKPPGLRLCRKGKGKVPLAFVLSKISVISELPVFFGQRKFRILHRDTLIRSH